MTYSLIYDSVALKTLSKLPQHVISRIVTKLKLAQEIPSHFFERLEGRNDYKLRIGDYRAIVDIDHGLQKITVTDVGHRNNIYKNMQD